MKVKIKESVNFEALPLNAVTDVNRGVESLLRASYRSLAGLPDGARVPQLEVLVSNFQNGSLTQDLIIRIKDQVSEAPQLAFAMTNFSIQDVVTVAKNVIEFFKFMLTSKEKGDVLSFTVEEGGIAFVVTGSNVHIGDVTLNAAIASTSAGKNLTKHLKNGALEAVTLIEGAKETSLTVADANCFNFSATIGEEIRRIPGEIIEFNKVSGAGSFRYIDGMNEVKKPFKVIGENTTRNSVIDSMKKSQCVLTCLEEYIAAVNGGKTIIRLHVLSIE